MSTFKDKEVLRFMQYLLNKEGYYTREPDGEDFHETSLALGRYIYDNHLIDPDIGYLLLYMMHKIYKF